jgi:hypothetical protein
MGLQHCALTGWLNFGLHQENVCTGRDAAGKLLSVRGGFIQFQ